MSLDGFKTNAENFYKKLESSTAYGVSIIYKSFSGSTFSTTTAQRLSTYTSTTLNAWLLDINDKDRMLLNDEISLDIKKFGISISKLSSPARLDQITYGGVDYEVFDFVKMMPMARWYVYCRRVE